jgi:hypothetical protein
MESKKSGGKGRSAPKTIQICIEVSAMEHFGMENSIYDVKRGAHTLFLLLGF